MCTNCESVAYYDSASLSTKDPALAVSLEVIEGATVEGRYDDAIIEYEKLDQYEDDPLFLYAKALAYIRYSNSESANVRYDRPGFMEDNATLMERSLGLASIAKELLAKAIYLARREKAEGNNSSNNLYALILAQLKSGDLRGAKYSLDEMGKINTSLIYSYAYTLFEARLGNYKRVMERADAIIRSDEVIVNAFFYAGLAMFKLGMREDAKKLLNSISTMIANDSASALIEEIRAAELV